MFSFLARYILLKQASKVDLAQSYATAAVKQMGYLLTLDDEYCVSVQRHFTHNETNQAP